MDLRGKTAVVTGAGSGIGESIAKRAAAAGAHVVVVDVVGEAARRVAREIRDSGEEALALVGDVANPDAVHRVRTEVISAFGRVDILVNNAGIVQDVQLHKMEGWQWDTVIAVNLTGTYLMTRAFAKGMVDQGSGRIVNIASRSLLGNFGQTNYAASKAGIVGLTKSLAIELGPAGINVNAIAPGYIETPIMEKVPDEVRDRAVRAAPLRVAGRPEDVANAAVFLASDLASYITGQCLFVCGGRSLLAALEMW